MAGEHSVPDQDADEMKQRNPHPSLFRPQIHLRIQSADIYPADYIAIFSDLCPGSKREVLAEKIALFPEKVKRFLLQKKNFPPIIETEHVENQLRKQKGHTP